MNLKDGSFQTQLPNDSLERLALDYSSRRNVTGVFGAGWCSALDLRVRPGRGRRLEVLDCDRVSRFAPAPVSALVKDAPLVYAAEDDAGALLQREGRAYRLELGTRVHRFSLDGELLESFENDTPVYRRLSEAPAGHGRRLRVQARGQLMDLTLNAQGLVTGLTRLGHGELSFAYDGRRLSAVREGAVLTAAGVGAATAATATELARFAYDAEDNLIQEARGGTAVFIDYDRRADRVRKFRGGGECLEKYEYDLDAGPENGPAAVSGPAQRHTEIARVRRVCARETTLLLQLENDYLRAADGELILIESRRLTRDGLHRRLYHPLLGSVEAERREPNPQTQLFQPVARPKTRLASE